MNKNALVLILSLLATVALFNISNSAFALSFIKTYEGNLKQQDLDFINTLIDEVDDSLPDINPSSWPTAETLYEEEEFTSYTFTGLENVNYLFIKYGNLTDLWYVGDVDSFYWESSTKNTLSNSAIPAPVPEPATITLLGFGIIGMVTFYRKKIRKI